MPEPRAYAHYRDDGPSGPCGQSMSITAPWSRLFVWEGENAERDAEEFMRRLRNEPTVMGRRNARVEAWWFEADGNVLDGPTFGGVS